MTDTPKTGALLAVLSAAETFVWQCDRCEELSEDGEAMLAELKDALKTLRGLA